MGHGAHTYQRAVRTRSLIDVEPDLASQMRSNRMEWLGFYAGTPGTLPDPMQGAMQTGSTLHNRLEKYLEHVRNTGRGHLAQDLMERLYPNIGATHDS
ncbi:hypothetical protein QK290_17900 [Pseudarthrobacter sp. AL07]|uniref:hypothetical protein n=1 Tax=unclassified Pseudarthrobacter TaxID=2647000 RepID=UPI00249CE663|nr:MULTISPECIES: hypothetical protein [unclassified Pseudarthrobacter]MDI3196270.1 hypothetical protein [Pseudarthrobacter sp. AL20]MDI3210329.1 hypothetical protein [Pseudarthrobacter sp. AL07]